MSKASTTADVSTQKSTNGRFVARLSFALFRGSNALLGKIAPGLAPRWAEALFLTPRKSPVPERELWWSTDAEETRLELADGCSLPAWRWGRSDRRVLLIHGWAGRGLQLGAFAAPLVARGFEVWAYDAPGHGRSPSRRWSFPEHRDVALAAIEALGGVEAVVAHSMGAGVLIAGLSTRPDLEVSRLVFLAPPTDGTGVLRRFAELTGLPWSTVDRMRTNLESRFDIAFADLTPRAIRDDMARPLLLLHDRDDREVPVAESTALARAWPGAILRTTEGLGHNRLLSDPATVERVVRFVDAQVSSSSGSLARVA